MMKLKKQMKKTELFLAAISIIGIVALFISLSVAVYRNDTQHSRMTFRKDSLGRTNDLKSYFSSMETILSVFISNIETMRERGITDRDLVVQMQEEVLKTHPGTFGIGFAYEPNAYDGMDEAYKGNSLYGESGIFESDVWKNGDVLERSRFLTEGNYDIYENAKNMGLCSIRIETRKTDNAAIPVFGLYSPIYDKNGDFIGISEINYTISFLEDYLDGHVYNDLVCLIIMDDAGKIAVSSPKINEISDKDLISVVEDIAHISEISLGETQRIYTRGFAKNDLMVVSDSISIGKEHKTLPEHSQFKLVHIAEKATVFEYLLNQSRSYLNMFIVGITIISFVLLLSSFLLRKRKDALTGVYGRDIVENDLPVIIKEAVASQKDVCLILADIDHFKKVNDTYGHAAGDVVLKNFSKIMEQCIRSKDWVSRYGGEEFLICLPDTNDEAGRVVAERIREKLQKDSIAVDGKNISVTASFGIASIFGNHLKTAKELIKHADENLYAAKKSGRNRVC